MSPGKKRAAYGLGCAAALLVELLIARYVHDRLIRPYGGDVLAVIVLYLAARAAVPVGVRRLPIYVFLFAAAVEATQYLNLVRLLGLEQNRLAVIILGATFDWGDLLCYGIGTAIIVTVEKIGRSWDVRSKRDRMS